MTRGRHHQITSSLLSKHGVIVTELASALLHCAPGERIKRVQEYAADLDASVGTIQSALDYLQESGAAQLEARGRLGTFAQVLHYPLLWSLAQHRPMVGSMPLPYTKRLMGLATGVRSQFGRYPIDLDLRYMRGAMLRLQGLASREYDWALVSSFAAQTAGAHGFEVDILFTLSPDTYMADHVLLMRAGFAGIEDGMRVGVDAQSNDHTYLTRTLCRGKQVELIQIEYEQGLKQVLSGAIDATVWSNEDIPPELGGLTTCPVNVAADPALAPLSEAAVIVSRGNHTATHVLGAVLDPAELLHIQQEVVRSARLPVY
jgi:hypothetical protein